VDFIGVAGRDLDAFSLPSRAHEHYLYFRSASSKSAAFNMKASDIQAW